MDENPVLLNESPEVGSPVTWNAAIEYIRDMIEDDRIFRHTGYKLISLLNRVTRVVNIPGTANLLDILNDDNTLSKIAAEPLERRKALIAAIVKLIVTYPGILDKVPVQRYKSALYDAKLESVARTMDINDIRPITDILDLVKKYYGSDSKQYLLIRMYYEVPVDRPLYNLKLIRKYDQLSDEPQNVIVYTRAGATVHINIDGTKYTIQVSPIAYKLIKSLHYRYGARIMPKNELHTILKNIGIVTDYPELYMKLSVLMTQAHEKKIEDSAIPEYLYANITKSLI